MAYRHLNAILMFTWLIFVKDTYTYLLIYLKQEQTTDEKNQQSSPISRGTTD